MKPLLSSDIDFIASKIKLSRKGTLSLLEEESDRNLVLNEVSKNITLEEAQMLSAPFYYKVGVFRFSLDRSFPIEEKAYVAAALDINGPKLATAARIIKPIRATEKTSQYLLVAMGLKYLEKFDLRFIDTGFRVNGRRELANHLDAWVSILHAMHGAKWLPSVIRGDETPLSNSNSRPSGKLSKPNGQKQ